MGDRNVGAEGSGVTSPCQRSQMWAQKRHFEPFRLGLLQFVDRGLHLNPHPMAIGRMLNRPGKLPHRDAADP